MKNLITTFFGIYLLFVLSTSNTAAQTLVPSEAVAPTEHALHGYATAISGDWAIATSPQKDVNGAMNVGGATFYRKTNSGWIIAQEVLPDDATALSNFGISASMDGNTAVFGAMLNSESGLFSGAAYVYTYQDTAWVQTAKLIASDAEAGHRFGHAVTVSGNTIVVGAYQANGNEPKSGAAYVFEQSSSDWTQSTKLFAEKGEANDFFGYSLDLIEVEQSTMIAVGAYNATAAEDRSGSVFIYAKENGSWKQTTEIFDLAGSSADLFGYSIYFGCGTTPEEQTSASHAECTELSNTRLFIGAPGTNNSKGQTGSVYHFSDLSLGFQNMQILEEQSSANKDHFGTDITIMNNKLFVSATRTNTSQISHRGNVYSYSVADVNPLNSFSDENHPEYGYFGTSISSTSTDMIVSAPYETVDGKENAGSVYFYSSIPVSNEDEPVEITDYKLEQNYPNPFNPSTTIKFQVREAGNVRLIVYNVLGQVVTTLVDELKNAGSHQVVFDASRLGSGMYFYRLEVNDFISYKKMLLVK